MFNATRSWKANFGSPPPTTTSTPSSRWDSSPRARSPIRTFGVLKRPQSWFLQTSVQRNKGLVSIWRREPELEKDADFDTENSKAKTTARFIPSVGDWRSIYGNPGV